MTTTVDLSEVRAMLVAATNRCNQLDRTHIPSTAEKKDRAAALAEAQRLLLFVAHLCNKAQMHALDEYHLLRGFTDHIPSEESR
jgi:hypothetical protein